MTTIEDLVALAKHVDRRLGLPNNTHIIEVAYGQPRLVRDGGSVDVSPRLSKPMLKVWIYAYLAGIDIALRPNHDPHR